MKFKHHLFLTANAIALTNAGLFDNFISIKFRPNPIDEILSEFNDPILSTFGVHTIVSGADGPLRIGDDIVSGLRARAGEDGNFEISRSVVKAGDQVRVQGGPMADLEGIFETELDSDRVMILLKLMGREVRVSVSGNDIEPL